MSRNAHFGIGILIIGLGVFWCFVGVAWFIGLAVSRDSVPEASIFDSSFVSFYFVWGSIFLACIWGAFRSFRQARRQTVRVPPAAPSAPEQQPELATPDEKLAHLVKRL